MVANVPTGYLKKPDQSSANIDVGKAGECLETGNFDLVSSRDNAQYIYHMLSQLRGLAVKTGEPSLVYYVEMAAVDASDIVDQLNHDLDKAAENKAN